MSGTALGFLADRIDKETYWKLVDKIRRNSEKLGIKSSVVPAYYNKPDFGDIDIVVCNDVHDAVSSIIESLKPDLVSDLVVKNGNVTSIGVRVGTKIHQIDLISASAEEYEFSLRYYSFNDLGNLIGRIAHKMGLKFGHDGLWLPLRDGDNLFANILLTQDFDKALQFLDYSPIIFRAGFSTLEEIFDYVVTNGRFNKEIYLLDNRNTIARTRERKRKTYMAFLEWVESKRGLSEFNWPKDKSVWLTRIFMHFPHASSEYYNAVWNLQETKRAKELFNGNIVMDLTGLTGKALGKFMQYLKDQPKFSRTSILGRPKEETEDFIKKEWEMYRLMNLDF